MGNICLQGNSKKDKPVSIPVQKQQFNLYGHPICMTVAKGATKKITRLDNLQKALKQIFITKCTLAKIISTLSNDQAKQCRIELDQANLNFQSLKQQLSSEIKTFIYQPHFRNKYVLPLRSTVLQQIDLDELFICLTFLADNYNEVWINEMLDFAGNIKLVYANSPGLVSQLVQTGKLLLLSAKECLELGDRKSVYHFIIGFRTLLFTFEQPFSSLLCLSIKTCLRELELEQLRIELVSLLVRVMPICTKIAGRHLAQWLQDDLKDMVCSRLYIVHCPLKQSGLILRSQMPVVLLNSNSLYATVSPECSGQQLLQIKKSYFLTVFVHMLGEYLNIRADPGRRADDPLGITKQNQLDESVFQGRARPEELNQYSWVQFEAFVAGRKEQVDSCVWLSAGGKFRVSVL